MDNGWIKLHRKMLDNPVVMKDADHIDEQFGIIPFEHYRSFYYLYHLGVTLTYAFLNFFLLNFFAISSYISGSSNSKAFQSTAQDSIAAT